MKGHRSRGRARRIVVAGHGRAVRLSGGEKRRWRHRSGVGRERLVAGIARHDLRMIAAGGPGPATTIVRTAKEKQAVRSKRAVAKRTPMGLLGRAARAFREKLAAA